VTNDLSANARSPDTIFGATRRWQLKFRRRILRLKSIYPMTPITLFYSWQSDRDGNLCRHFIEKALEQAAELLRAEGIALTVDADTRNVPGTPPVTETILKKIDASDIFLADMTFVGATEAGKLTPNPNAMGEYGWALKGLGHERILLAMNTAFGTPGELPFDLRHWRFPLQYNAGPGITDGARRDSRTAFARKLADAISTIVRARGRKGEADADATARAQTLADEHRAAFARGNVPALVSRPCLAIRLVPLAALGATPLRPRVVTPVIDGFFPPGERVGIKDADERMWWKHGERRRIEDKPNQEVDWMFSIARPGVLQFAVSLGRRIDDDPTISVDGLKLEAWIVRMTETMLEQAHALGLSGPAVIDVDCEGLDDVDIVADRLAAIRLRRERIDVRCATISIADTPIGMQLRDLLDDLWLAIGRTAGSPSFSDDNWGGYQTEAEYRLP
jgi:hypothetical protein